MPKTKTRLSGHGLRYEGKVADPMSYLGHRNGSGPARCECGEKPPVLPTTSARQRWHREHKLAMREADSDA